MAADIRKRVLWAFAILAVLCPLGLGGIAYFAYNHVVDGPLEALRHEIQMAEKEGIPLRPADLVPSPPIPDPENAAVVYRPFLAHIQRAVTADPALLPACRKVCQGAASRSETGRVDEALTRESESLREIIAATGRPSCDFGYAYKDGFTVPMPELSPARTAAWMLCAKAEILAEQGKIADAIDVLAAAHRLSEHVAQTPIAIAFLVSGAIESIACAEFARVLQKAAPNQALLDRAGKMLETPAKAVDLRHTLGGEVVMGWLAMRSLKTTNDIAVLKGDDPKKESLPLSASTKLEIETKFVASWRRVYGVVREHPRDWWAIREKLRQIESDLKKDNSASGLAVDGLISSFVDLPAVPPRNETKHRLLAVAIALLSERLRDGAFPKALPHLGQSIVNPYTSRPFEYKVSASGFTLSAPDGKDNSPADLTMSFN